MSQVINSIPKALQRATVFALDAAIVLALCLPIFWPTQYAYAYVDPSVMTYTIQALAGVAVALSAVAAVALRRVRKKLIKVFNIDENAHKIVDTPVHRVDPHATGSPSDQETGQDAATEHSDLYAAQKQSNKTQGTSLDKLPFTQRLWRAALVAALFVLTIFLSGPMEVVMGNTANLLYQFGDVAPYVLGIAAIAFIVLTLVLSLLRGRAFTVGMVFIFIVAFCAYIQVMLLNTDVPAADGMNLSTDVYGQIAVINTVIWLVLAAVIIGVTVFKRRLMINAVIPIICGCLIIMQGFGIGQLLLTDSSNRAAVDDSYQEMFMTRENLYEVSTKGNTIVLILDAFDNTRLQQLYEEQPDLFSEFTDFTYYKDCTGKTMGTTYSLTYLLSNRFPDENTDFATEWPHWYENSTQIKTMAETGYALSIYTDSSDGFNLGSMNAKSQAPYFTNMHNLDRQAIVNPIGAIRGLYKYSFFRNAPWILKFRLQISTEDMNEYAKETNRNAPDEQSIYNVDDIAFYQELTQRGITENDSLTAYDGSPAQGSFKFIHFRGAHAPFIMDENMNRTMVSEREDAEIPQCIGSLKITAEYLRQLKAIGAYDRSNIIIMADHGQWYQPLEDLRHESTSPIFIFKPAATEGSAKNQPFKVSSIPISQDTFAPTILKCMGSTEYSQWGTPVDEITENANPRYTMDIQRKGGTDWRFNEEMITGPVTDFNNWELTGRSVYIRDL